MNFLILLCCLLIPTVLTEKQTKLEDIERDNLRSEQNSEPKATIFIPTKVPANTPTPKMQFGFLPLKNPPSPQKQQQYYKNSHQYPQEYTRPQDYTRPQVFPNQPQDYIRPQEYTRPQVYNNQAQVYPKPSPQEYTQPQTSQAIYSPQHTYPSPSYQEQTYQKPQNYPQQQGYPQQQTYSQQKPYPQQQTYAPQQNYQQTYQQPQTYYQQQTYNVSPKEESQFYYQNEVVPKYTQFLVRPELQYVEYDNKPQDKYNPATQQYIEYDNRQPGYYPQQQYYYVQPYDSSSNIVPSYTDSKGVPYVMVVPANYENVIPNNYQYVKYQPDIKYQQTDVKYQPDIKYQPEIKYQPDIKYQSDIKYQPDLKYQSDIKYQPEIKYQPDIKYQPVIKYQPNIKYQPTQEEIKYNNALELFNKPIRYTKPEFKHQPTSLLDSYIPSYLQYAYYKQQESANNAIRPTGKTLKTSDLDKDLEEKNLDSKEKSVNYSKYVESVQSDKTH